MLIRIAQLKKAYCTKDVEHLSLAYCVGDNVKFRYNHFGKEFSNFFKSYVHTYNMTWSFFLVIYPREQKLMFTEILVHKCT